MLRVSIKDPKNSKFYRAKVNDNSAQRWNQPPLRFNTESEASAFIASELAGNPLARIARVED